MKTKTLAALITILGIALSTSALAQGRHDEKPHGMVKPAATQESKATRTATGGRHDEGVTTHGARKTTAPMDTDERMAEHQKLMEQMMGQMMDEHHMTMQGMGK